METKKKEESKSTDKEQDKKKVTVPLEWSPSMLYYVPPHRR